MGVCLGPYETEQSPSYLARLARHRARGQHERCVADALDAELELHQERMRTRSWRKRLREIARHGVARSRIMGGRYRDDELAAIAKMQRRLARKERRR